jgi:hypothetical protein
MKDDDFREEVSGASGTIQLDPALFPLRQPSEPEYRRPDASRQIVVAEDVGLRSDVRRLENRITALESLIRLSSIPITTLGDDKWEIKSPPLNVSIEQRGPEDFIACLYDVDVYGYGDTIPGALNDLKSIIVGQFEYLLERQNQIKLGKIPKQQLEYLGELLVKKHA